MTKQLILALSLALSSLPVQASMMLDRTILTFVAGEPPRHDVSVANPDEENLYLEVTVLDVTNPGTAEETRTPVKNPEEIGLVAAPRLLMVPPGGRRMIRLVNLQGHTDNEKVYRVNVTPVPPPMETEGMALRVLVAYQLLIFVEPISPKQNLEIKRDGKRVTFQNKGNTNIHLTKGQQCPEDRSKPCTDLKGSRLYPGNTFEVLLPEDRPAHFTVTSGNLNNVRQF